jgi:5'-3' exonuclease
MPILMDYSQVMMATLFANIGNHTNVELSDDLIRHMFLVSLKHNRKKFFNDYGEIVICCDGKNSWRREAFPYYKANRRAGREQSDLNWNELFRIMGEIRDELSENFPYKVIQIDRCEADDIIGVVCHEFGTELNTGSEKFLVLSGDKDYIQLQKYANVDQYDPVRKKWITHSNPDDYLVEHVFKGDTGDGVPNILSPDNCLVVGERQKPMTAKKMALFKESFKNMDETTLIRFHRNQMMIDLRETPDVYKKQILEAYNEEKTVGRSKLFNYFMQKKLKNLMSEIGDF